jgi:hypothetical protein
MRSPAGQRDDLERRGDAAAGKTVALDVDFAGPDQRLAPQRTAAAIFQDIAGAHAAQVAHQRQRRLVGHRHNVRIRHRQSKPSPLQQTAQVSNIRERRDMRTGPTLDLCFGQQEGLAQLGQCLSAEQRAKKQAIRLQRAADLEKRTGQVVEVMQAETGCHEIKRGLPKRKELLIGEDTRCRT